MYSATDETVHGRFSSRSSPRQSNHQNINGISKDTTGDGSIGEKSNQCASTMSGALTSTLTSTCRKPDTTEQTIVTSGGTTYPLSTYNIISI